MYIPPRAISAKVLPPELLRPDRVCCTQYDDFGLGERALYVGLFGLSRMGYIPLSAISRVYKRLGVTKGFFEQGNIYGTLCYLVVCFDGKEKAYRFGNEATVDALLDAFRAQTTVPVGKI